MRKPKPNWFETLVMARRILQARPPESRLSSTSRTAESARALTLRVPVRRSSICTPQFNCWPVEHCANEPEPFLFRSPRGWALRGFIVLLLSLVAPPTFSAVHQVQSIDLTVSDLDEEVRFFTQVLSFENFSHFDSDARESSQLLGLSHAKLKIAVLKLGNEKITLTEHSEKGQPIPPDSRSNDRWFQHIAIVVRDMDRAYDRLKQFKVKFVSTVPQTLPEWNKAAAGIKAFYFRDPEDHVLEIIWFPRGKGDPKWQVQTANLFLGIDHTAIVVSDTDTSLSFYRDLLGMHVTGESENYGEEQEHLNQVFGAHLRITALRAESGPGIEFLEYLTPPGGRPLPETSKSNDLVFWHTDVTVDHLDDLESKLKGTGTKLVSFRAVDLREGGYGKHRGLIARDPDGHALEFLQESVETASSAQR
jgi:catechol 2,3-dioxygenase-like lactoylglutathione lyase family enzyme